MALNASSTPARTKARIMIVDDEAGMGKILVKNLELEGYEAVAYRDPVLAIASVANEQPDLILTDVRMPGLTGLDLLEKVKADHPDIPVLIMTAYGTIEDAVAALKAGAFNYITKPFQQDFLLHQIEIALRQRRLEQEVTKLSEPDRSAGRDREIIGTSAPLAEARMIIDKAAQTDSPVLITGESGTGKELLAREIHEKSNRRSSRFVAVNCPAIPTPLIESELFGYERGAFTGADQPKIGLIELSSGGTLFLDEIGELNNEIQAKLLRALQEREVQRLGGLRTINVDLRVLAATNRDLEAEIKAGRFREDLYYRLNVIRVQAPPLRARPGDLPELVAHFLARASRRLNRAPMRANPEFLDELAAYRWPGNVRELENVVERAAIFATGEELGVESLPPEIRGSDATRNRAGKVDPPDAEQVGSPPANYKLAKDRFEKTYIESLMAETDQNVTKAAKISGISRRTLYEKLEKYGLKPGGESKPD